MKTALGAFALILLSQFGIGTAGADDDSYLSALRNFSQLPGVSFNQPTNLLLNVGYQVCANTRAGVEQRAMIRDVLNNNGLSFDAVQATFIVNIAQDNLCFS